MRITDLLALSHVPRWSIVRHSPGQSVADHSFRVAVLYLEICTRLDYFPCLETLTRALFHDGAEARSGDIPSTFKERLGVEAVEALERGIVPWLDELPPLSKPDERLLKLADLVEAVTFIHMNGNGPHALHVERIIHSHLTELADMDYPRIAELIRDILSESDR